MENIPIIAALSAGFFSFLSPCVLPLVPIYLAILAGPEILEAKTDKRNAHIFLHSLMFVAGFTAVFVGLGAGAGLAGLAISTYIFTLQKIGGIVVIVFGALLLLSQKVPKLNLQKHLTPSSQNKKIGYPRSFLTGAILPMVLTPCVGPILGTILMLAIVSETAWSGASLLAIYSLGLGIPFLIIGAAFDSMMPLLRRIQRYSKVIYIISGVALIVLGILLLTGILTMLTA